MEKTLRFFSAMNVVVNDVKEENYACLALSLVPGMGPRCLNQLVHRSATPRIS
jgi:hypothetical protein